MARVDVSKSLIDWAASTADVHTIHIGDDGAATAAADVTGQLDEQEAGDGNPAYSCVDTPVLVLAMQRAVGNRGTRAALAVGRPLPQLAQDRDEVVRPVARDHARAGDLVVPPAG